MTLMRNSLALVLLAATALWLAPTKACAQIAPQTCDTDVWTTMTDRARLETEREIMQNQNLIFKPDSVLQYTCFDNFASHAANEIGDLFTHTAYWGAIIIPKAGPNGMPAAITNVVLSSLGTYLNSSFNYSLLGGRGASLSLPSPTPLASATAGSYSCGVMANVWQAAKCLDFMHTSGFANTDGYYPFKNLAGFGGSPSVQGYEGKGDVRQYPAALACASATPVPGGWAEAYNRSVNNADVYYPFRTPNQTTFNNVRALVHPGACGAAIPTGIQVILGPSSTSTQPDGVCSNPGCTYIGGSCS